MNSNHFSLSDEAIESTYQTRSIETDVGGGGQARQKKSCDKQIKTKKRQIYKVIKIVIHGGGRT